MRVGVLTSGGDCPGLNAGISEVSARLTAAGATPVLIPGGYAGLQQGESIQVEPEYLRLAAKHGGTVLGASRTNLGKDGALESALAGFAALRLDAVVVFGGDGSLRGVSRLVGAGILAVGIPKTIDADVGCTETSIGFSTAVQTGCAAVEAIEDTARSHKSSFLVEVMGRRSGILAAAIARAAGSDGLVVPEADWDLASLAARLRDSGGVVVVAESAWSKDLGPRVLDRKGKPLVGGVVPAIEAALRESGLSRVRTATLGHLLRGGQPVASDRLLAQDLAEVAVREVLAHRPGLAVVRSGRACSVPASEGLAPRRFLSDPELSSLSGMLV